MKYSCADFTFPLLTHDKVLDLLKLLGFNAVDLGIFEERSHNFPSQIVPDPARAARKMKEKLDARGMVAADVFLQTGAEPPIRAANDPDAAIREQNRETFKAMIEYALELECYHITGLPGVLHEGIDEHANRAIAVEETTWRVETAISSGVVYSVESHVGSLIPDPQSTLAFLSEVPGLTLTLDYGHYLYQGMRSESAHALIPYASHFHARGGADKKLQSTMNENEIDFAAVMAGLKQSHYTGFICLEYVWIDWEGCNRTDNISETILLRDLLQSLE